MRQVWTIGFFILLLPSVVWSHKPSYSDGRYVSQQGAYQIKDVDVSIVVYHKAECNSLALWMKFDLEKPKKVFVQLGIPKIVRLLKYRPRVAVLAKGLKSPSEPLPFKIPEGYGAVVFSADDIERPRKFHEPFTNTNSLLLVETKVAIPQAGVGYVVAWHPKQTGKYWVAVGEREDFGPEDYKSFTKWFDKTQAFHEVGDYEDSNPPSEKMCEKPKPKPRVTEPSPKVTPPATTKQPPKESAPKAGLGCSAAGETPWMSLVWFLFLLPLLLRRLRRL